MALNIWVWVASYNKCLLFLYMSHLEAYNALSPDQFGFCKIHSAELQLLQTVHDLAISLNITKVNVM